VTEISSADRKDFSICIVGSDPQQVQMTSSRLEESGFSTTGTTTPEEALEKIQQGACRVVIADLNEAAMDDLTFLEKALRFDPGLYAIVVARDYEVDSAVEAVKRGAYDFLSKPIDFARLERTLDELADVFSQRSHMRYAEEVLLENSEFHGVVGKSPAMLEVFDLVRKVARHYSNVLISGPTGSGKELVAGAVHELSPVAQERFVVCNCSALVDTLLESQLFGHVRGSFTGATDTRAGLFEYANNGTVFLDEISETSIQMQAKLLRVIQNREIQRVGSPEVKKINVRLIAATNRDLYAEVQAGRFREDLFYRLSSIEIRVPGLAERMEDIPVLVKHFLKKYSAAYGKPFQGLTRRAQIALLYHDWPGNVRELENVIAGALLTASAEFIDVADLPEHLRNPRQPLNERSENWPPVSLEDCRRAHIQRVLTLCNGNRVRAAELLGIGKTSLYRFLKRYPQGHAGGNGSALGASK
jgi:DNA-binding NtrC family response regulator